MIDAINDRYNIILASQSPRRKQLLSDAGIRFKIQIKDVAEDFPADIEPETVASFLSEKKFKAYQADLRPNDLLITADTVVLLDGEIIGKPTSPEDAVLMLTKLSERTHTVITGTTIGTKDRVLTFDAQTKVTFARLSSEEIQYYIEQYRPFDKAGSYGIQEWIGYIGIERIEGSFYNVMGLPIQMLYRNLIDFSKM